MCCIAFIDGLPKQGMLLTFAFRVAVPLSIGVSIKRMGCIAALAATGAMLLWLGKPQTRSLPE